MVQNIQQQWAVQSADVTAPSAGTVIYPYTDGDSLEWRTRYADGTVNVIALKHNYGASVAPTANDDSGDGYSAGSIWVDTSNDNAYICLDNTSTAAVWEVLNSGSSIGGSTGATDNAILRANGTGGATIQSSGLTISDSNVLAMADNVIERPEIKDYAETLNTDSDSGASHTIDLTNGNVHDLTLTANCTLTFSNPPASGKGGSFTLILRQDGTGSRATTFPASVDWAGGSAPTLTTTASAVDILTFLTVDGGTTWYGFLAGADFS